jgi:DNA invertase Pin-like site-specific DNA recombinase
MLVGYARVSTPEQSFDGQVQALIKAGVDERHIYKEQISGAARNRPALEAAMSFIKEGDTLVFFKLDRLGRSVADLIRIMNDLTNRKITFKSLTENFETETASGKMLFNIIATLAEFERTMLIERTKAGQDAARRRGIKIGPPSKITQLQEEQMKRLLDEGKSKYDIAKILGLKSRTCIYKFIKRNKFKEGYGQEAKTKTLVSNYS